MTEQNIANNKQKERINSLFAMLTFVVSIIVVTGLLLVAQLRFSQVNDFPEYYAAVKLALSGKAALAYDLPKLIEAEHIYFPAMGGRGIAFYIPPFSLPILLPVALIPTGWIPEGWTLMLLGVLSSALVILCKIFPLSKSGMLWLVSAVLMSGPAYEALRIGQLAPLLLLAFVIAIYAMKKEHDLIAGLSLLVLLLKPQILLPILIFLASARRWKIVFTTILLSACLLALSFFVFGIETYNNYFALLTDSASNMKYMQPELNATLRGQLLRFPALSQATANAISLVGLIFAALSIYLIGGKYQTKSKQIQGLLLFALPIGLVFNWHCHDYDLLLLVPSVMAFIVCFKNNKLNQAFLIVPLITYFLFVLPVYADIHYSYLLKGGVINPQFIALFLLLLEFMILSYQINFRKKAEIEPEHSV